MNPLISEACKCRRIALDRFESAANLLGCVVTTDQTLIYFYYPKAKQQPMELRSSGSPRPKKFSV